MKKIILSLSGIAVVAALVIASTGAFFSDTETSTGNTFTAGAIDLKVDSHATYNGAPYEAGTWGQSTDQTGPGLDITSQKFFNFGDVKPGDSGEDTISLHVINNDAWLCAAVSNLTNDDNGLTEPEALVDSTDGVGNGELRQNMDWKVWRDDGAGGGIAGDNIQNGTEQTLTSGHPTNGTLAIYDSTTATGPLTASSTAFLGVSWSLPLATGNEVQTDSMTGDISFNVVQSRNNAGFQCAPRQTPPAPTVDGVISQGEYDGALSMPIQNTGTGTVKAKTQGGFLYVAADIVTDATDNRTFPGFNDEFAVNLGKSPAINSVVLALGSTNANGRTVGTIDGYFTNFPTVGHSLVASFASGHRVIEWAIPLSVIPGIANGDTLSIAGATESTDGNSALFPIGWDFVTLGTFGSLLITP